MPVMVVWHDFLWTTNYNEGLQSVFIQQDQELRYVKAKNCTTSEHEFLNPTSSNIILQLYC